MASHDTSMFVKTKERSGRTVFFLCIAESSGSSWKSIEHSVCLGETLDLNGPQWVKILRSSPSFRSISLERVLEVLEKYVADSGLPSAVLGGLREAAGGAKQQKSRPKAHSERRGQESERVAALRLLGLPPGSSDDEIESAFRKAARHHHPDVGGDPERFRAVVDARNLLLGRATRLGEIA
jgi:hypothetical protein